MWIGLNGFHLEWSGHSVSVCFIFVVEMLIFQCGEYKEKEQKCSVKHIKNKGTLKYGNSGLEGRFLFHEEFCP